jgi:hypothetical protein
VISLHITPLCSPLLAKFLAESREKCPESEKLLNDFDVLKISIQHGGERLGYNYKRLWISIYRSRLSVG